MKKTFLQVMEMRNNNKKHVSVHSFTLLLKQLFYIVPFPAHSKRARTEKETKEKAKKPFVS
jgi:hypothetical protein